MPESVIRDIFAEGGHNFSGDVCPNAVPEDLDEAAIAVSRAIWVQKSGRSELASRTEQHLLMDAEAIAPDGGITYAALALFGKREVLGRLLPQCKVIFEYRSNEASGPAQQRVEFRQRFFFWYDELLLLINRRNDLQHYQSGLFVRDVPTFDERATREAIMNAVCHRDYQMVGSVFVTQYPRRLVVDSPGGFPHGITIENILDRQAPRNRRLAELLHRCGLVERAGQGMNLMFEMSVRQSKTLPDFKGTDRFHVRLTLDGLVHDSALLAMMEHIDKEIQQPFGTEDFLIMDAIHRGQPVPEPLRERLPALTELGLIERTAKGKYILSRRFYAETGKKGVYTRVRGLDRETNKALLLKHLFDNREEGSRLAELCQVFPNLSASQVRVLLKDMKNEGIVCVAGHTNAARWFAADAK